jgi:hypothetical protein
VSPQRPQGSIYITLRFMYVCIVSCGIAHASVCVCVCVCLSVCKYSVWVCGCVGVFVWVCLYVCVCVGSESGFAANQRDVCV